MTKFNTFYLIVFIVGMALWFMTNLFDQTQSEFYGVAKTKETELNKNYDLAVDEIYVTPGELVRKGQKLLEISRIREEEKLMGQDFEIDNFVLMKEHGLNLKIPEFKILKIKSN